MGLFFSYIMRKYPYEEFDDVREAVLEAEYDLPSRSHDIDEKEWAELHLPKGKFLRMHRYLRDYGRSSEFKRDSGSGSGSSSSSSEELASREVLKELSETQSDASDDGDLNN